MCEMSCAGMDLGMIFNIFLYILFAALAVYVGYKFIKKMLTHSPKLTWVKRVKAAVKAGADLEGTGNAGCSGNAWMVGTIVIMGAVILASICTAIGFYVGMNW